MTNNGKFLTIVLATSVFGLLFAASSIGQSIDIEFPEKGDKWVIRTWNRSLVSVLEPERSQEESLRRAGEVLIDCEVMNVSSGEIEILAEYPRFQIGLKNTYLVFMDSRDRAISRVLDRTCRGDGSALNSEYKHKYLDLSQYYSVPAYLCEFPAFNRGEFTFKRNSKRVTLSQRISSATDSDEITVKLTQVAKGTTRDGVVEVVQPWKPGVPWWLSYTKYVDGEITEEAELVEYYSAEAGAVIYREKKEQHPEPTKPSPRRWKVPKVPNSEPILLHPFSSKESLRSIKTREMKGGTVKEATTE